MTIKMERCRIVGKYCFKDQKDENDQFRKRAEKQRNTETSAETTGYKEREDQSNP